MSSPTDPLIQALQHGGLAAGLRELNSDVPHRYTGVYRLHGGFLKNIELHDKQGEVKPDYLCEVPLAESFCQFVLRDQQFRTDHSGQDTRLAGHKYQGVLLSYHGVPVLDAEGALFGTLCHFDLQAHALSDAQYAQLQQAAQAIGAYLPR